LYVPGLQAKIGPTPLGPVYPTLATQAMFDVLAAGEIVLVKHVSHAAGPATALNFPAAQGAIAPPGPVYPALAVQAATAVLPAGEVEPVWHGVKGPPFGPVYPALAVQAATAVLLAGEAEPVGHGVKGPPFGPVYPALAVQAVTVVLAGGEFDPVVQLVHTPAPVACLYVPAAQGVIGPPFGPVYPGLATQAVAAVLASVEFEFCGQGVLWVAPVVDMKVPAALFKHVVAPCAVEYLPTAQFVHNEPSREYFPAEHCVQAVATVLPVGEDDPAAQSVHTVELAAPTDVEYLPTTQLSHAVFPLVSAYFPPAHAVHVAPFL
jgi:hypothetical protein